MNDILIVDDDRVGARTLQLHMKGSGHASRLAHGVDEALAAAAEATPRLIIMDIRMPGRSGLEGLTELKELYPQTPVIMITAFHDMETTVAAMQRGAEDYIHKPIDLAELDAAVASALRRCETPPEAAAAPGTTDLGMVGHSRAMKEVYKSIGLVAGKAATVLITGESGTGKELAARAIHSAGGAQRPFIVVNCAALVETLLESDMYGHERGAFTGALSRQPGKFALARGGTLMLDEVGELPPTMQAKLLRVLQSKEFTPLGASHPETTDARIIAATNADLAQRVRDGTFREDLYFRLQVVNIHLPPLRERLEDLPDLVDALLRHVAADAGRALRLDDGLLECFLSHPWPGNVRELENRLVKAAAFCTGNVLTRDLFADLCDGAGAVAGARGPKARFSAEAAPAPDETTPEGLPAGDDLSLAAMEARHVQRVLDATGWHRGRACDLLGVSRPRLRRLIAAHGLQPGVPTPAAADDVEPGSGS